MFSAANHAETLVNYRHRNGCSLGQERLDEFVAIHGEYEDTIVLQTHEVVVIRAGRAVDLDLIRMLLEHLGQVDVND